jgi:hypothetical protein
MTCYAQAHEAVFEARGKASDYPCAKCGGPARDWSYDYQDPEQLVEDRHPYSLDVDHYLPMCRLCHRRHEIESDPRVLEAFRASGKANVAFAQAGRALKFQTDPEFAEKTRAHARSMATPESRSRGGKSAMAKMDSEAHSRAGLKSSKIRKKCSECGLETNPGALGRHLKATGHMEEPAA